MTKIYGVQTVQYNANFLGNPVGLYMLALKPTTETHKTSILFHSISPTSPKQNRENMKSSFPFSLRHHSLAAASSGVSHDKTMPTTVAVCCVAKPQLHHLLQLSQICLGRQLVASGYCCNTTFAARVTIP